MTTPAEALERLTKSATLLHANCIECAIDHHSLDYEQQGLPGWLSDTGADIAAARAALPAAQEQEKLIGELVRTLEAIDNEATDANKNGDAIIPSHVWDLVQQTLAIARAEGKSK